MSVRTGYWLIAWLGLTLIISNDDVIIGIACMVCGNLQ